MPIKWKTAIITLSDKGYAGEREDKSGPLVREMIERAGYEVTEMVLLPDERMMIEEKLKELCDERETDLILTTGGTGFYIQALLYDIDFTENDGKTAIREELERLAVEKGPHFLHQMLEEIDPASAEAIHENNIKRVIRAIEFYRQTGGPISLHNQTEREKESPYNFLYYVLTTERAELYARIDRRVDQMLKEGLVDEVRALKASGCHQGMVSMQGLGYKEILRFLDGEISLEEAIYILKRDTRHFAKRQLTWFKRERDVTWLNLPDYNNDRTKVLEKILSDVKNKFEMEF